MVIYIGADHRGFKLKESLKNHLHDSGYEVVDEGNAVYNEHDDYPDFAKAVAEKVQGDPSSRKGILICGSGAGMDIAANKFDLIRSTLSFSPDHAAVSKNDDDTNVLSLAADFVDDDMAKKIVTAWLLTKFSGLDKHKNRIQKLVDIEMNRRNPQ